MIILSIETSCDETAISIVKDGLYEISSSIASSKDLHIKTGGVVPEVASRKQLDFINHVFLDCLDKSKLSKYEIDAIAVTVGPGLIGSLIVGIEFAKTLCFCWNKPLIQVNHLIGHVYSAFLQKNLTIKQVGLAFPSIGFVVSGGHTDLILIKNHNDYTFLGGTLDDAVGEAFDKTARLLGLSKYLGAVELSNLASSCDENTLNNKLPRPMINSKNYDFSFSGLKTAVKNIINKNIYPKQVIACEFENAVCDVLVKKCINASKEFNVKSILLGGGVSANTLLRKRLAFEAEANNIQLFLPPLNLTGDNAFYIATSAYFLVNGDVKNIKDVDFSKVIPLPSLEITSKLY